MLKRLTLKTAEWLLKVALLVIGTATLASAGRLWMIVEHGKAMVPTWAAPAASWGAPMVALMLACVIVASISWFMARKRLREDYGR